MVNLNVNVGESQLKFVRDPIAHRTSEDDGLGSRITETKRKVFRCHAPILGDLDPQGDLDP